MSKIQKEELHVCPGCGFFTLIKGIHSTCEVCSWMPNPFSKNFPVQEDEFLVNKSKKDLISIQKEVIKFIPIKAYNPFLKYEEGNIESLNGTELLCIQRNEYLADTIYKYLIRHPLWKPIDTSYNNSIEDLKKWYNNTIKYSTLSELGKQGIVNINDYNSEKVHQQYEIKENLKNCMGCGFESIEGRFRYDICKICFWEDDDVSSLYPHTSGGPNHESLIELQEYIIKHIPLVVKEHKGYKRNKNWKPIDKSEVLDIKKPLIQKWFYQEVLKDFKEKHIDDLFKEAQKYNPTKN